MKIRISRQDLLDAVNKVKSVVSPKSALPILSHILIETGESSARLSATDLKVSIECSVDCTVEEAGSLTVSSQRLSSMLAEFPDGEVVLSLGENSVIGLQCGRIDTKLFSMSPDEFPPVKRFENIEPVVFPQALLKKVFMKTSFAVCRDQGRYNLTGVLVEMGDGRMTVVATDGRRMSAFVQHEGIPEGIEFKVIIPGKMITELERLLGDEGEVNVCIDQTQAAFAFDSLRLVTALIEGNFPNYDMVIPKKHDKEVNADVEKFIEAMRRTRIMTNEKFNSVRVHVSDNVMTFKVVTPEVGEYTEEMTVGYDGSESIEVAFNPDFVLDVLRRIDTKEVLLCLKDAMSPGLLKPKAEEASDDYINVIMPIRI